MAEMLHEYRTDDGVKVLCEDCAEERKQARLACGDCDGTVENLPRPRPPDIGTLMQWEAEGGCEAACPHGCWVEPDGRCPHGKPSWLIVMGLI